MKILVIAPYFDEPHRWMISGQKTAYELSRNHQVIVLTTGQKVSVEKKNKNLKIYRIKDIFLRDPVNYSIIPGLLSAIRKIVQQEKPEAFLINKHMFFSSLAIWPLKRMGKYVVVQTDTFPGINWFPKNKAVGIVMWIYARLIGNPILRKADKVILLHEGLVEDAKKLRLKYEVIHNGINLQEFDSYPVPNDLHKKKGEIWVGYVGRLESVKGWYDLAAVAKKLVPTHKTLHFFFIGPTLHAEERIKEFIHPQIHFLGLRKDVPGIDKLLDVFVMPSLSEGLSNAIMEAMAAKCCCLVSRVGGNMILVQDEVTGRLFKKGDQTDLKNKLLDLINDLETSKNLGVKARERIEAEYDLRKNVRRIAAILNS